MMCDAHRRAVYANMSACVSRLSGFAELLPSGRQAGGATYLLAAAVAKAGRTARLQPDDIIQERRHLHQAGR